MIFWRARLAKRGGNSYKEEAGSAANTSGPFGARPPRLVESQISAPVEDAPPTGATCVLEVQETNHHSRKDGGQQSGQHIPEKVLHGSILLSENVPTSAF